MRGSTAATIAWRNALFAVFGMSGIALATWVARVPAVRDGLGVNTAELGLLILGISAGAVIGLVVAPSLVGRLGARRAMRVLLLILAVGIAGAGLNASLTGWAPAVFLALAVFGFGNGALDVVMNLDGALAERALGKTTLPLLHGFFSLGTLAGAGIGALASALAVPVGWHFSAVGVLVVVLTLAVMRYIPETSDAENQAQPGTLRERFHDSLSVWRDPRLILIGLIMLGMAFAEGSAMDWIAVAAVDGHGLDNTLGALVLGVFVGGMLLGRIVGGPLIDRFGRVTLVRGSALVGAVGVAIFIFSPVVWLAVAGIVLWALGCSLGFPVGMSAAADDHRGARGTAAARVSAVAIIGYVAFLVGPPLLGWLGEQFGILRALLVILAMLVVAAVFSFAAREATGPFARPAAPPVTAS